MLEESSDAFFQYDHSVLDSGGAGFLVEQLQWFFDRFMREAEGSVVHGNHPAGFQIQKSLGRVRRIGVDIAKLFGIVGADWQQGEFGSETASDFAEAGKIGCVAGVINGVLARLQDEASVAAMGIFQYAGTPVPRRNMRY